MVWNFTYAYLKLLRIDLWYKIIISYNSKIFETKIFKLIALKDPLFETFLKVNTFILPQINSQQAYTRFELIRSCSIWDTFKKQRPLGDAVWHFKVNLTFEV